MMQSLVRSHSSVLCLLLLPFVISGCSTNGGGSGSGGGNW